MEIDRARAISEVAQTVINSAKVEVDYLELTGQMSESEFLKESAGTERQIENGARKPLRAIGR
jgi:hypothetical protein